MSETVKGRLVTGETVAITVRDGLIDAVTPWAGPVDRYVGAGLVDLQVNGYFGLDLNHLPLPPERVVSLTEKLFAHGVTTTLPTLITASPQALMDAMRAISEAREADPRTAHAIAGIHVEGRSSPPPTALAGPTPF